MLSHIFPLKNVFPVLYERCEKPVTAIPVFFEDKTVAMVSLDDTGSFRIALPSWLEGEIMRRRNIRFVPNVENLNRSLDPEKIRMRITALKLNVDTPRAPKPRAGRQAKSNIMPR